MKIGIVVEGYVVGVGGEGWVRGRMWGGLEVGVNTGWVLGFTGI